MLRRLWLHRDLLVSLVLRQYQLRYRQSAVGFAWAVIPPLATLGVATLVFHRVARVDTGRTPYVSVGPADGPYDHRVHIDPARLPLRGRRRPRTAPHQVTHYVRSGRC